LKSENFRQRPGLKWCRGHDLKHMATPHATTVAAFGMGFLPLVIPSNQLQ